MRRTLFWTVLLALLALLLYWRSGVGARQLSYYAPDEYVERADDFIRRGYLAADCSGGSVAIVERLAEAPERERSWYAGSYLSADVRRLNADPDGFGWAFVVDDDCRLRGVNPVVHAIDLPFTRRVRWLGSILYRGHQSDAVLRSARRTITLRQNERPLSVNEQAATRVGSREDLFKEGTVLLYLAGGRGQPAARIHHVGDDVVVQNRVRSLSPESVRLMGHQLPVGMIARLESGDWLTVEGERPVHLAETFVFTSGEDLEAASRVRRQNQRLERRTEDPGLGLAGDPVREQSFPFLDLVARSIDAALSVLPEERAEELARGLDVQLTIDRDVQVRMTDLFAGYASEIVRRRGLEHPFAAGLTVMDAMSGEILALATWPQASDVASPSIEPGIRHRLLRNQNLLRHPIGSAGKPFLFAAIADTYPELLDFTIAGHEAERYYDEIFQCAIPTGYQLLEGHGSETDFRTALEISCNRYTVELATLALAADLGGGEVVYDRDVDWPAPDEDTRYWLGGWPLRNAPDLSGFVFSEPLGGRRDPERSAVLACSSLDRFEQVRYRGVLGDVTGAATYRGRLPQGLPADADRRQLERGYTTNRYDLDAWRPLLEHLLEGTTEEASWRIRGALQEISPERVNLAFNQVTQLRGDMVSLLLGGATSTWTNVQLAEATSRLVTGRAVEARLVASEATGPAGSLVLTPEAHDAVLDGMERVVSGSRGTARNLRDALEEVRRSFPDDRIYLFSKTGSPVLERAVPAVVARVLERLVVEGRLRFEGATLALHSGDSAVAFERGDAFREALREASAELAPRADARLVARILTDVAADFVADARSRRGGELTGPLRLEGGVLRVNREDRLFRRRMVRQMGSVYLLTLVRVPHGVRWSRGDPLPGEARAVSAAIHLEIGPDSSVAVGAAGAVLPELAALLR